MSQPVLFVHGITEIGGAERGLLMFLDHLPELGYSPIVVCPNRGPLVEEIARLGIETRYAPMPPWRKLFAYHKRAGAIRALRAVIGEVRPVLIHVDDIWWVPQSRRAADELRIPILAHVLQEVEPAKVRRYELDCLDRVFPASRQIQRSLEAGGVLPDRLQTLYYGVDLNRVPDHVDGRDIRNRFGIPADALVLGTVANLFARKGYDVMLQAFPTIVATFPNVHYLIVGSGDAAYEESIRSLVKTLGQESHVHFAGFQDSVYPCLAAMDVYVHPARMEGFGIAVLEAMAMRKPVVVTATGGLPEIVQDGETGLLVPPSEQDALAQAVKRLLRDPVLRRKLGDAGRDRVASMFTVDAMMANLVKGYQTLVGRTGSSQAVAR